MSRELDCVIRAFAPTRTVSLHEPLACVDYDGRGCPLAEAMAQECNLPLRRIGALPGSLGSYAGEDLDLVMVTLELPRGSGSLSADVLWERFGRALLTAVTFEGPALAPASGPPSDQSHGPRIEPGR